MSYYSREQIEFSVGQYCETSIKDFPTAHIKGMADDIYVDVKKNEWSTYILLTDIIKIPFIDNIKHKILFKLIYDQK